MINPRFTLLTLFALAVITLVILTRVAPTMAQSQSAAPATTLPSDEQLDALVTTHDWNGLGAALSRPGSQEGLGRSMNWLRTRIDAGGGFFLGILYARNLWVLGDQYKIDDLSKDLRLTAGMMTLYTYQLIVIDGAKCEDVSAPGHRVEQLFSARAATLAYLKTKPADVKEKIVDLAIALEKKTAPLRKDDELLCSGGLDQMKAGLERGTQREVPSQAGQLGKTVAVEPPSDWHPKFLAPEKYQPVQEKNRSAMKAHLLTLLK